MNEPSKEAIETISPCEKIYAISPEKIVYGNVQGICRVTGKESTGVLFNKWVRKTFNDWDYLKPGTIISNEALFCFDEASELIKELTGREKPQRFRTYSHIIHEGQWHILTKANKEKIYRLIISGASFVCLAETGQKHILFKHKDGLWQLEDIYVSPNIPLLEELHTAMCNLMKIGFSQAEIMQGQYKPHRIMKCGLDQWKKLEEAIKPYRDSKIFQFTSFMLYK